MSVCLWCMDEYCTSELHEWRLKVSILEDERDALRRERDEALAIADAYHDRREAERRVVKEAHAICWEQGYRCVTSFRYLQAALDALDAFAKGEGCSS